MPKLSKEDHEAVLRYIVGLDEYIRVAMGGLDRKNQTQAAVWNQLDLAIARLKALSAFLTLGAEK
ncbi:MAG: hypothetical protein ABSG61_00965 [Gemmatimonadales bacterium]|jgi:hypothetical protein